MRRDSISNGEKVRRDIVVVGASAGGVSALETFVRGLPPDLRAAVFVVLHIPDQARSELAAILCRCGPLPAIEAASDMLIEPGRIYIAPPDRHLFVMKHRVLLWPGPKENRHRPSINALFRSASVAHGQRVVGIVLSGFADDGTTGLWWVKQAGGLAIVQDPLEAQAPDMPRSALEHVEVDYTLHASQMGPLLARLACPRRKRPAGGLGTKPRAATA